MEFSHLEFYLQTGKYHPDTPDFKKRGIRKASHNFVLKGTSLVYIARGRSLLVCRTDEEKKAAVQWAHDKRASDEFCNPKETIKMIQKSFYWHGITRDFDKKLFPCEICQPNSQADGVSLVGYGLQRKRSFEGCDVFEVGDAENSPFSDDNNANGSLHPEEALVAKKIIESLPHKVEVGELEDHQYFFSSPNDTNHSSDTDDWLHRFHSRDLSSISAQSNPENLVERITDLEAVNSMLVRENEMLKKKLVTLHRTLENQKNLPALEDLIKQLKQSIPQTITTTISNFTG